VGPKTERFEMRLDESILERVDAWRGRQPDVPTRSESVRRLVETGLAVTSASRVSLDDGGKLVASMLCDIHRHLKISNGVDPSFVESAISGGHYWALKWEYPGIFHDHEDDQATIRETIEALDVWAFIESGYSKLAKKDKLRVEQEAPPFGKSPTFTGFDGNNESEHYSVARFLVDKMGRFAAFSGRDLNSHVPLVDRYKRMHRAFEPIRATLMGGDMNAQQIITVLNAGVSPK
jgi:uncharacterized protein